MIAEYDVELVAVRCEQLGKASERALKHQGLPDWLLHRFATIRAEALSLAREIENYKREGEYENR